MATKKAWKEQVSKNTLRRQLDSSERKARQSAELSQRFWSGMQAGGSSHTSSPSSHCSRAGGRDERQRKKGKLVKYVEEACMVCREVHSQVTTSKRTFYIPHVHTLQMTHLCFLSRHCVLAPNSQFRVLLRPKNWLLARKILLLLDNLFTFKNNKFWPKCLKTNSF